MSDMPKVGVPNRGESSGPVEPAKAVKMANDGTAAASVSADLQKYVGQRVMVSTGPGRQEEGVIESVQPGERGGLEVEYYVRIGSSKVLVYPQDVEFITPLASAPSAAGTSAAPVIPQPQTAPATQAPSIVAAIMPTIRIDQRSVLHAMSPGHDAVYVVELIRACSPNGKKEIFMVVGTWGPRSRPMSGAKCHAYCDSETDALVEAKKLEDSKRSAFDANGQPRPRVYKDKADTVGLTHTEEDMTRPVCSEKELIRMFGEIQTGRLTKVVGTDRIDAVMPAEIKEAFRFPTANGRPAALIPASPLPTVVPGPIKPNRVLPQLTLAHPAAATPPVATATTATISTSAPSAVPAAQPAPATVIPPLPSLPAVPAVKPQPRKVKAAKPQEEAKPAAPAVIVPKYQRHPALPKLPPSIDKMIQAIALPEYPKQDECPVRMPDQLEHIAASDARGDYILPLREFDFEPFRDTLELTVLAALRRNHIGLVGGAGLGKSDFVRFLACYANRPLLQINMDGMASVQEMLGKRGAHDGNSTWSDGVVVTAMRYGWWCLMDEYDLAEPCVQTGLHSVFEEISKVTLKEKEDNEVVRAAEGFQAFVTGNSFGTHDELGLMQGVQPQSAASKSRFIMIPIPTPTQATFKRVLIKRGIPEKIAEDVARGSMELLAMVERKTLAVSWGIRGALRMAQYAWDTGSYKKGLQAALRGQVSDDEFKEAWEAVRKKISEDVEGVPPLVNFS